MNFLRDSASASVGEVGSVLGTESAGALGEGFDSEEGGAGNITRQTLNDARLQVDDHGVAKTLSHEGDSLIVRGDVRTFAEMGQDLDVSRKMLERITRNPFRQRTD